mmetsp:Transcript_10042/g.34995  ORF Transcript_10042/g.34995 Transcript_10042/m.34995 type:complete len:370 (+) Transcript_10042:1036-2145(+)
MRRVWCLQVQLQRVQTGGHTSQLADEAGARLAALRQLAEQRQAMLLRLDGLRQRRHHPEDQLRAPAGEHALAAGPRGGDEALEGRATEGLDVDVVRMCLHRAEDELNAARLGDEGAVLRVGTGQVLKSDATLSLDGGFFRVRLHRKDHQPDPAGGDDVGSQFAAATCEHRHDRTTVLLHSRARQVRPQGRQNGLGTDRIDPRTRAPALSRQSLHGGACLLLDLCVGDVAIQRPQHPPHPLPGSDLQRDVRAAARQLAQEGAQLKIGRRATQFSKHLFDVLVVPQLLAVPSGGHQQARQGPADGCLCGRHVLVQAEGVDQKLDAVEVDHGPPHVHLAMRKILEDGAARSTNLHRSQVVAQSIPNEGEASQ